ncbi:MAG: hypothetical protein TRG1_2279 [Flavobacteriaceae bacterium FS1-H7996/R]|nr:MAG: hypothetical protein TRG1_2279 [Flavobacteriaceae bacterium FS1-H7996/R]
MIIKPLDMGVMRTPKTTNYPRSNCHWKHGLKFKNQIK